MWRRPGYGDHLASTVDPDIHARQAEISAPPGFADAIAWLAPLGPDETPHWHVTFAVADRDEIVAAAVWLGCDRRQRTRRHGVDEVSDRARSARRDVHPEPVRACGS